MQVASNFRLSKLSEAVQGAKPTVCSPDLWHSGYTPTYLTHITRVFEDNKVDICVVVYLPNRRPDTKVDSCPWDAEVALQVKVNNQPWESLLSTNQDGQYWSLTLERVPEGSRLFFRYRRGEGEWQPISPLGDIESIYGATYVPSLRYNWTHQPPRYGHGRVLMETTLEGLLAGYKGGRFAPSSFEELYRRSIGDRLVQTDIPGRLAEWGIDQLLVPVCSSMANRAQLDPKFNYLTYNFVDVDWQIGRASEFKQLVDTFYGHKIQLVPDLIFAHQVKVPFEGSLDRIASPTDEKQAFVDVHAFLFRDYGTWMLELSVPEIRRMLIEKVVAFIMRYQLKVIRIDYVDGLILQYSNRPENYGEVFIRELKAELRRVCPDVTALGETFEASHNEAVKDFIDVFYSPIGFSIVEELYKPRDPHSKGVQPDAKAIADHLRQVLKSTRKEAFYAQLHDEVWYCPHVSRGRPHVPWAYGKHPAQLAKNAGEALVGESLLEQARLLEYVRRTVRNAEALTMFSADFQYMFSPAVDSLSLGALDDPDRWQVQWEGVRQVDLEQWRRTGLSSREIFRQHERHRSDMVSLRKIFRQYTQVDEENQSPLVSVHVHHANTDAGILGLFRQNHHWSEDSLLVIFNLGSTAFHGEKLYEVPTPPGFDREWMVVFDGDWEDPQWGSQAYAPGTILRKTNGYFSNIPNVLRLRIGARSLIILKYHS